MPTDTDHATHDGELDDALRRMLGRVGDAAGRPPSLDALEDLPPTDLGWRRGRSTSWLLGAVAAVVVIALATIVLTRSDDSIEQTATSTSATTAPGGQPPDESPSGDSAGRPTAAATTPTEETTTPAAAPTTITVDAGQTVAQIAESVGATGAVDPAAFEVALEGAALPSFIDASPRTGAARLEGLLGLGDHPVAGDADALVASMIDRFAEVADDVGLAEASVVIDAPDGERRTLRPYEIVIVASLVETQTTVDAERPRIARVILNRLAMGVPLGIDAAVESVLGRPVEAREDLEIESPYNLRIWPGLPPSPIGAPSAASLAAVIDAEPGEWLYYVRTDENGPGTHTFAVTAEEFTDAVEQCRDRRLGCERTLPGGGTSSAAPGD